MINPLKVVMDNFRVGWGEIKDINPLFWWLMVLKFLESYSYFTLSQVLVIFLHTEFGMSDMEAGIIYGVWGFMITASGMLFACVNDSLGVRNALLIGFVLEMIGNSFLVMTTNPDVAKILLFTILPVSSSLGIPMLTIGVKRFTHSGNRGFAFGIFYTVMNVAAFIIGPIIDCFNVGRESGAPLWEGGLSGNRIMILSNVFACFLAFYITYSKLTVNEDEDESGEPREPRERERVAEEEMENTACAGDVSMVQVQPPTKAHISNILHDSEKGDDHNVDNNDNNDDNFSSRQSRPAAGSLEGNKVTWAGVKVLLTTGTFWRYAALSLFLVNMRAMFRHLDATFPTYLLREHGDDVPKGSIFAINPLMVMLLTPVVATNLAGVHPYVMIRRGSWFTGFCALPLALSSTIAAAICYVVLLSVGESLWSPATYSYAMTVSPVGQEATFAALATAPLFAAKIPVGLLGGYLLSTYMSEDDESSRNPKLLWAIIGLCTLSSAVFVNVFESCIREPEDNNDKREHTQLRTDSDHGSDADDDGDQETVTVFFDDLNVYKCKQ